MPVTMSPLMARTGRLGREPQATAPARAGRHADSAALKPAQANELKTSAEGIPVQQKLQKCACSATFSQPLAEHP